MNTLKFELIFTILLSTVIGLAGYLAGMPLSEIHLALLGCLALNQLGPLALLGVGLGLPAAILAILFGWVQLILIMKGLIPPHLSSKGFMDALYTLLIKGSTGL